jgi:hypothetical protein
MSDTRITDELLAKLRRDRELIATELPELAERDARMQEAAAEETLCGHLRRAVHASRRPLRDIARDAGISTLVLCDFLEGERTLRSDVLDRITRAAGVTISVSSPASMGDVPSEEGQCQ